MHLKYIVRKKYNLSLIPETSRSNLPHQIYLAIFLCSLIISDTLAAMRGRFHCTENETRTSVSIFNMQAFVFER